MLREEEGSSILCVAVEIGCQRDDPRTIAAFFVMNIPTLISGG